MTKRLLMSLTVLTLVGGAASLSRPSRGLAAAVAVPIVLGDTACELRCRDGEVIDCPPGWHDAWEPDIVPPSNERGQGAHEDPPVCYSGTCEVKHPACGELLLAADLERLRGALAENDVGRAAEIVNEHKEFVSVNIARAAVQWTDCFGAAVGHFPLKRSVVTRLENELTRMASHPTARVFGQPD